MKERRMAESNTPGLPSSVEEVVKFACMYSVAKKKKKKKLLVLKKKKKKLVGPCYMLFLKVFLTHVRVSILYQERERQRTGQMQE